MPKSTSTFIQHYIAKIDSMLNLVINNILHHPAFQKLEASWRGLQYLVSQVAKSPNSQIKIRLLNISWQELSRDLTRAIEFDQSQIFQKIYSHEFDLPGGEPFGLLIGDYCVSHKMRTYIKASDIAILQEISKIAAASFSPFITAVDPSLFGLDSFAELNFHNHLERIFQQVEYQPWKILRDDSDSRFLGLVLPFVLLRQPYNTGNYNDKRFFLMKKLLKTTFIFGEMRPIVLLALLSVLFKKVVGLLIFAL